MLFLSNLFGKSKSTNWSGFIITQGTLEFLKIFLIEETVYAGPFGVLLTNLKIKFLVFNLFFFKD